METIQAFGPAALSAELRSLSLSSLPPSLLDGLELWERGHRSRTVIAPASLQDEAPVPENEDFDYCLVKKAGTRPNRLIFLLHGLNERRWDKYIPWARRIALNTDAAVALFPLAFHMNRSPHAFGEMDTVFKIYRERKAAQGAEGESSHANAMLSARLEDKPYRFFTSGLQSFRDVVDIARAARSGLHPDFPSGTKIDFFGYSIGAFLAEILIMANPEGLFSDSRLFVFCGGAVMDATRARSRAILDGKAERALTGLFHALSEGDWSSSGGDGTVGPEEWDCFLSMLGKGPLSTLRERRLAEIGDRISGVALRRDAVFPADGILKTLGERVAVMDFPFEYRHEVPFPQSGVDGAEVESAMDEIFGRASGFLGIAS